MAKDSEDDDRTPFPSDGFPSDGDDDSDVNTVALPRRETTREGTAPKRPARRRRAPHSGDLFFLLAIFIIVLLVVLVGFQNLTGLLYSPIAGILLFVVVIEYLVLKSMDRTRVYQMENQRLRDLRRGDKLLLRRARDVIEDRLADTPTPNPDDPDEKKRWRTRAEEIVSDIASSI